MEKKSLPLSLMICILLFVANSLSIAQQKFDFSQLADETNKFIIKPLNWDKNDFLTAGSIIAGTALLMQFDKSIKAEMMKDRSYENRGVMLWGTIYGDAKPHLALGAGLLAHGFLADNNFTKKFGYELLQAIAYSGAVTVLLKVVLGRERPAYSGSEFNFSSFSLRSDQFQSIPSGHSSVAFAVSTVIASKFEDDWLKALCYVPAVITAFSRVYNNRHWASDSFLGSFIGYFIGKFVVELHDDNIQTDGNSMLSVKIKL